MIDQPDAAAAGREISRILAALTAMVGAEADAILVSLEAAIQVDLAVARAGLGATLRGNIPAIGTEGALLLHDARHPVLQLRGVNVIGNNLSMTPAHPGLVLTGPNAGGKTVALKTFGLCALMVRAGIPLPAGPDSLVLLDEAGMGTDPAQGAALAQAVVQTLADAGPVSSGRAWRPRATSCA